MEYNEALKIATEVLELIKPHCYRAEIAGSIRRKKPEVKDVEIVAIPMVYDVGLFESGIATVVNQWEKVKGELDWATCKYTQRILPQGIKLDLFFASPTNFGLIYLIRTGDWEFSKKFLGTLLPQKGYKCADGKLYKNGLDYFIETKEEIDLFNRAGISYIEPENRNITNL